MYSRHEQLLRQGQAKASNLRSMLRERADPEGHFRSIEEQEQKAGVRQALLASFTVVPDAASASATTSSPRASDAAARSAGLHRVHLAAAFTSRDAAAAQPERNQQDDDDDDDDDAEEIHRRSISNPSRASAQPHQPAYSSRSLMDGVFSAACRMESSRTAASSATVPNHEIPNHMPYPTQQSLDSSGGAARRDPTQSLDSSGAATRRGVQQLLRSSTGLTPSSLGSRSSSPAASSSFRRQASMAAEGHGSGAGGGVGGRTLPSASPARRLLASMTADELGGGSSMGGSRSSSPASSYRRQASMSAAAASEGRRSGNGSGLSAAAAAEGRRSGHGSGPSSPASSSSYRRQASLFGTAAEGQSNGAGGGEAGDGGGGGNPRSSCSRLAMAQLMASFDSLRRYVGVFPEGPWEQLIYVLAWLIHTSKLSKFTHIPLISHVLLSSDQRSSESDDDDDDGDGDGRDVGIEAMISGLVIKRKSPHSSSPTAAGGTGGTGMPCSRILHELLARQPSGNPLAKNSRDLSPSPLLAATAATAAGGPSSGPVGGSSSRAQLLRPSSLILGRGSSGGGGPSSGPLIPSPHYLGATPLSPHGTRLLGGATQNSHLAAAAAAVPAVMSPAQEVEQRRLQRGLSMQQALTRSASQRQL